MEEYKIIVRKGYDFYVATFDNRDLAKMSYNGMIAEFVKHTKTNAAEFKICLVSMTTRQVCFEAIITDGTIFEQ